MGNELEVLIRKAGRLLADHQVARLYKIPEEMQRTPCDFMGFTATGRAILIEAKHVHKTSLPVNGPPGLRPHQFVALNEANKAGAISLLCWAQKNVCAVLSWDVVLALKADRVSIPWNKIEKRFLRPMETETAALTLFDHWLPTVTA